MNKIILILIVILTFNLNAQQWETVHNFANYKVINVHFVNANTGWVVLRPIPDPYQKTYFYKTTNKGVNWFEVWSWLLNPTYRYTFFVDINTGYQYVGEYSHSQIHKTTNGGINWDIKPCPSPANNTAKHKIKFINVSTGYVNHSDNAYFNTYIYKTTNGGDNWSSILTIPGNSAVLYRIYDFAIYNNQILAVGIGINIPFYNTKWQFVSYYNGSSWENFIYYPQQYDGRTLTFDYVWPTQNGTNFTILGTENINGGSTGTFIYNFDVNSHQISKTFLDQANDPNQLGGLSFSNSSTGYAVVNNNVYKTNDGGFNWNVEYNMPAAVPDCDKNISTIGEVAYVGAQNGDLYRKKVSGMNLITISDFGNVFSGGLVLDGVPYSTPQYNLTLAGGTYYITTDEYVVSGNDTNYRFYFWGGIGGNGSNYHLSQPYYFVNSGNINADFKGHMKSSIPEALKNANQVKALKDTNGVTNLLYESMGGIFFTRTRPDGNFKCEEFVSTTGPNITYSYPTFNNTNPHISEIMRPYKPTGEEAEENIVACWEQREGSNIKIYVKYREVDLYFPYLVWGAPYNNGLLYTIYNAPEGFKCFPKIFYMDNFSKIVKVLTFLKPDGSNKKLVAKLFYSESMNEYEYDLVPSNNIQEYAVSSIPHFGGLQDRDYFNMYIAYRINQAIFFKRNNIGWNRLQNGPMNEIIDNELQVSNENSQWRASVDISLRNASNNPDNINMQPVITYQGQRNTRVRLRDIYGSPYEIDAVYYPIFVRERLSGGGWGDIIRYELINTPQQTPIIEGSKQNNSCLLNYTQNTTTHIKVVPRWNGAVEPNTWFCNPTIFSGTDARLIKGALINNTSTSQKLMTLTSQSGLYNIGTQNFTITSQIDPGVEDIYGVIINDNIKYSFNLGSIMVNWNAVNFDNVLDTAIEDIPDFNDNFTSATFYLNDYDTLVIERNAFYVPDDGNGTFQEIEYRVNLINKTSGGIHEFLAHDTVHVGDSIQVEYLEGFVIDGIQGGSDSFYVQMEVDTLFTPDGGYGIGGGGGSGEGDNINTIKQNVFWAGENITFKNNNLPTEFSLYQNYPNPFNPVTKIKFDIPVGTRHGVFVQIKVYDLLGREVTTLVNEFKQAGRYEVEWPAPTGNAVNYASGVYVYRIEARQTGSSTGEFVNVKKMVLVK